MIKRIIALVFALALACACLVSCSGATQPPAKSLQDAMYALRDTNLLESPDGTARVLAKVSVGKAAKLIESDGEYARVKALGKEGFILSADLTDSEDAAKAAKKAEKAAAEEAAKRAEQEAAAQAAAEEKARAEEAERTRLAEEEADRARARAEADAQADAEAAARAREQAAAEAQVEAEAEAARQAAAEAEAAAAASTPTVVAREYVPPCDGHANGYTVIVYSDGSEEIIEGRA